MSSLFTPITLPCGLALPNRIAKAAMEENQAEAGQRPGASLHRLYRAWAEGGAGMILTGNVMVDARALTGPGGVVMEAGTLDEPGAREAFEAWAEAGTSGEGALIMQISHPGRQVYATQVAPELGTEPVSASATKVSIPGFGKLFATARELTDAEIGEQIERFAATARAAESCGFDGVQVHAAHGYLVAQFLSPLTNLREDRWGGSLENRACFLLEIVRAVRAAVSPSFCVGVKLNSADFQRGGFTEGDAARVVGWLNAEAVDFVELSGGNYESAAMTGRTEDGRLDDGREATSTEKREAYFLDFVPEIAAAADMPVMVTGGVTRLATAERVVGTPDIDMVGVARAIAVHPDLPARWRRGDTPEVHLRLPQWKNGGLASLAGMAMAKANLDRVGRGQPALERPPPIRSLLRDQLQRRKRTRRYKAWLAERQA